jgi:hypothetical protein
VAITRGSRSSQYLTGRAHTLDQQLDDAQQPAGHVDHAVTGLHTDLVQQPLGHRCPELSLDHEPLPFRLLGSQRVSRGVLEHLHFVQSVKLALIGPVDYPTVRRYYWR